MTADAIRQIGLADRALLTAAVRRFRASGLDGGIGLDQTEIESWVTAFVAERNQFAFVALVGTDVVGWAWGQRVRRPGAAPQGVLAWLEVAPARRRQGTGTLLLDAVFAFARRQGCIELVWSFDPAEVDAAGFGGGIGHEQNAMRRVVWHL